MIGPTLTPMGDVLIRCLASVCAMHYILPLLTKSTTNGVTIFTLKLVAMSYVYIQYSAKLITLLDLVILPLCEFLMQCVL